MRCTEHQGLLELERGQQCQGCKQWFANVECFECRLLFPDVKFRNDVYGFVDFDRENSTEDVLRCSGCRNVKIEDPCGDCGDKESAFECLKCAEQLCESCVGIHFCRSRRSAYVRAA